MCRPVPQLGEMTWPEIFLYRAPECSDKPGARIMELNRRDNQRVIRAPRGSELNARSWQTEAPLRMLMNNLDAEVAECPEELVVYGGIGRAARDWRCYD